ncbi:integrase core domain-containing protein [Streptomyces kebangsaanensis]|uniref:Integrase core domain-containing protein n=1 Tax=Streptomyces kebangsaanensis TaxID=864058 RepID=A0ABW6KLL7_9ACTN
MGSVVADQRPTPGHISLMIKEGWGLYDDADRWARRTVSRVTGRAVIQAVALPTRAGGRRGSGREQGRFAQGGEKVVGKAGFAGGARAGVQGDPAGRRMVGGQGGMRVDGVVVRVDDHGDGRRWHGESFDAVFAADGIEAVWTASRALRMNAHGERGVGTLRREVLDHPLIWNETHALQVLDAYARHHNCHRPHQARGQLPPLAQQYPAPKTDLTKHRVLRRRVLGGVINEYGYAA